MKVAFFSPHSAIWVHAFPEALVAEALEQQGHDILYLTCGRVLNNHCVPMTSHGYTHEDDIALKNKVCEGCEQNKDIVRREFEFKGFDVLSVLSPSDYVWVESSLASLTTKNFLDARYQGVEYGRAALSSFLLVNKKNNLQFSEKEWKVLFVEIRNALLSLLAASHIFQSERPDRLVLYSPGYSVNLVWAKMAAHIGIPQYYIQGGNNLSDRLQKLIFVKGLFWQGIAIQQWRRFKDIPCGAQAARYVVDHFLELFQGRSVFVYSLGRNSDEMDVRARFGVCSNQKLLVATMSSYDELFAGEITGQIPQLSRGAFSTQLDWVTQLIHFIKSRDDLFLLIRVHPREFPNHRDGVKSEHGTQLEGLLKDLPENIRVNWPSDGVSLYALAEEMDLCLNAWSNAGKEMTFLGIPVVLYSTETIFYHPALNYAADTKDEYFRLIEEALSAGWQFDYIRAAFRWYAFDDLYSRISLNESFHFHETRRPPMIRRIFQKIARTIMPGFQQKHDCRQRASQLHMRSHIAQVIEGEHDSLLDILRPDDFPMMSLGEEKRVIQSELKRLVWSLYGMNLEKPGGQLKRKLIQAISEMPPEGVGISTQV